MPGVPVSVADPAIPLFRLRFSTPVESVNVAQKKFHVPAINPGLDAVNVAAVLDTKKLKSAPVAANLVLDVRSVSVAESHYSIQR